MEVIANIWRKQDVMENENYMVINEYKGRKKACLELQRGQESLIKKMKNNIRKQNGRGLGERNTKTDIN